MLEINLANQAPEWARHLIWVLKDELVFLSPAGKERAVLSREFSARTKDVNQVL